MKKFKNFVAGLHVRTCTCKMYFFELKCIDYFSRFSHRKMNTFDVFKGWCPTYLNYVQNLFIFKAYLLLSESKEIKWKDHKRRSRFHLN